ncbi:MAG TPA: phosphoenolpyruvate-utilizing N-terminal domain-containing protein, partial [Mycobacterium sp.]|nr:phosphoenolpyruvate-utilizing N-terminal domain-containing protein [Mycobacterium sp.]
MPNREDGLTAPVSMARATLEQRLSELPGRFEDLRRYLDGVVLDIRAAGDVEAAGSEVEDAHREALTKVTEAERRAAAAERTARNAEAAAKAAQEERDEADSLTEEATAEAARVRADAQAEIARARAGRNAVVDEIQHMQQVMPKDAPPELTALLDVHLMLLQDETLTDGIKHWIRDRLYNAEWALTTQLEVIGRQFDEMEDPYL